jgi:hypothetical protein
MSGHDKNLGRLEPVDLHEIWTSEPGDFTPWLAKEENLALLGEAIGIDLELEALEKNVGPFRADMLCKDTSANDWVVIESQLDPTNHDHLGKVLTYAAGLKAKTIVWIAKQFTDEHRAALDWLNQVGGERVSLFGIQIELWRIGDSHCAPRFNVVCRPNDWSERVTEIAEGELSEVRLLQQEFWAGLRSVLLERKSVMKPTKPLPQSWFNFAVGRSHFWMTAAVNTQKHWIQVSVSCGGDNALAHFRLLEEEKEAIEREVGCPLAWEELPGKKEKRIALRREDVDPTNRDDWPSQHAWMAEKLEAFHRAFAPRIRDIDLEEQQSADEESVGIAES